jgi:fatty acid desaturase
MKHHQYLGDVEKDPDSRSHLKLGYNDTKPWKGNPFINYLRIILNPRAVSSSLIGNLLTLSLKEYFMLTCWWGSAFILLSTIGTLKLALGVVCVWFMSKVTTYHMIRILAEFLDHSGLEQGEVISFSRNLPHNGVLRFIFHPNCDTYHIVHHLYPRIPHYNLAKADFILQSRFDYAQSHQCDSYFFGKHSAASCWVGSCGGTKK